MRVGTATITTAMLLAILSVVASPLVGLRLQSLLGYGSRHCLGNHLTQNGRWGFRVDCESTPKSYKTIHIVGWKIGPFSPMPGAQWCSSMTRHLPSIFRSPIVSRNSSSSLLPARSMLTHFPFAVAKAMSDPAVTSISSKLKDIEASPHLKRKAARSPYTRPGPATRTAAAPAWCPTFRCLS